MMESVFHRDSMELEGMKSIAADSFGFVYDS